MADTLSRRNTAIRTRTVSSNEAKQHWGAMMKAASEGEAVIVESHGKPKAVVISPEAYQELRELRDKQRRAEAQKRFEALERRLEEDQNHVLTDDEIELIAIHVGREINAAATRKWRESLASKPSQ